MSYDKARAFSVLFLRSECLIRALLLHQENSFYCEKKEQPSCHFTAVRGNQGSMSLPGSDLNQHC